MRFLLKSWSNSRWEYWLVIVIALSLTYTTLFILSSLQSNDIRVCEARRSIWEVVLFTTNGAFCILALLHLFIFDRQERSIINPELSRLTSLALTLCPLLCASFDPFKKAFIRFNTAAPTDFAATGAISFILVFLLICIVIKKMKEKSNH